MSARFEELGWRQTPMGVISFRRRFDPSVRTDVYEIKLDDEYLMASLFTVAEKELARLGLARTPGADIDVIVGGLCLGYSAREALECNLIRTLTVIEYSDAVIDWHERDLLPDTAGLAADSRVALVCADFFASATDAAGFDPQHPGRTYDAILLDIDHSPRHVLHQAHADFYTYDGLQALSAQLAPAGRVRHVVQRPTGRRIQLGSRNRLHRRPSPGDLVRQPLLRDPGVTAKTWKSTAFEGCRAHPADVPLVGGVQHPGEPVVTLGGILVEANDFDVLAPGVVLGGDRVQRGDGGRTPDVGVRHVDDDDIRIPGVVELVDQVIAGGEKQLAGSPPEEWRGGKDAEVVRWWS